MGSLKFTANCLAAIGASVIGFAWIGDQPTYGEGFFDIGVAIVLLSIYAFWKWKRNV